MQVLDPYRLPKDARDQHEQAAGHAAAPAYTGLRQPSTVAAAPSRRSASTSLSANDADAGFDQDGTGFASGGLDDHAADGFDDSGSSYGSGDNGRDKNSAPSIASHTSPATSTVSRPRPFAASSTQSRQRGTMKPQHESIGYDEIDPAERLDIKYDEELE